MRIKATYLVGAILSLLLIMADIIFFRGDKLFFFIFGIAVVVGILPFFLSLLVESKREKEKNEQFLEFTRNLAESVKTGTPIGKSIINMKNKDFGSLTQHVQKLANQIALGIPTAKALQTFAFEVDSNTIKRAIALIQEAENAGGEIDYILDSVARSMYQVEKLKKERQAAVSALVVQGYIIFFIFLAIMLVMQFKILPLTSNIGSIGSLNFDATAPTATQTSSVDVVALARPFLYLLLVQGFFAGLTIGKLSEGSIKAGIKHSIVLSLMALLISSGANAFLG